LSPCGRSSSAGCSDGHATRQPASARLHVMIALDIDHFLPVSKILASFKSQLAQRLAADADLERKLSADYTLIAEELL
jgi:hypothetical protein